MTQHEEAALVESLKAMDEGAWERFAREYSRPLLAFAQARFDCGREAAEEIVQMAFVRCVRSIGTFDPSRGALYAWLKAVTANEARTLARREKRRIGETPLSEFPDGPGAEMAAGTGNPLPPDELLARRDFRESVRDALMRLDSREREVLVLKYVDGLTVADIALRMGVSQKAAESVLSRARRAFSKSLGALRREYMPNQARGSR